MSYTIQRPSICVILKLTAILILPTSLVAAIKHTRPDDLIPIDTLQEALVKKYQSKSARITKRAYDSLQKKKFAEAISLGTKLVSDRTFSDYGYWILSAAHRGVAQLAIQKKDYSSALKSAQKAISSIVQVEGKNPYSPFLKDIPKEIGRAEILMGEAYWGTKKWELSEHSFERAFQRFQTQNMLLLVSPNSLDQYSDACEKLEGPLCPIWLQKLTSVLAKKSEELKAISKHFPTLADKAKPPRPNTGKVTMGYKAGDLDQVAFDLVMKLYFDEKYSQAIKLFRQFLDDYPRSAHRFRARYWLAQALTHEQEHEKAQKVYEGIQAESPLSYYGLLASNASGKPIDSVIRATLPTASETDPALQPQEIIHLKRAQSLIAEKAYDLAAYELKSIRVRDALSSPFLIYLSMLNYHSRNYHNGFQLIGELLQRGHDGIISSYGLRLIFPVDYLDQIKKHAEKNDLDPILVLSLIKQESAFEQEANSPVGAMGLMQLMPATANETDPNVRISELLEADRNIGVGTLYLKKLLTRFNGNIVYALAGYNAGPTAVDRWIKEAGGKKGMLEFIEAIPYKETREYVGSIIRNYFWYSRRLNGITQKNLNYFWNVYGPPEVPGKIKPEPTSAKLRNGSA